MRSNILNKVLQRGRKGNPLSRIDALEQKNNAQFLRNPSADRLTDITQDLGTILSGSFIAPAQEATSAEPTDTGFTGAAMGGDGWTFGSTVYHFVAVAAGVLQAGFNAAGKFLAGAGSVTLDEDGIEILVNDSTYDDVNAYKFTNGSAIVAGWQTYEDAGSVASRFYLPGVTGKNNYYNVLVEPVSGQSAVAAIGIVGKGVIASVLDAGVYKIKIAHGAVDVDTEIYGSDGSVVLTVDSGLRAVGLGGAAESGYILKATGKVKTTGDIDATAGINVGSATGAGTGDVKGSGELIMAGTGASSVGGSLSVGGGAAITVFDEGSYTPSLTNTTNVASSTALSCYYMRVGTKVTVWGAATIDPTAAGNTVFAVSFPIASNLAVVRQCVGHCGRAGAGDEIGNVEGDTTNDRAVVTYTAAVTSSHSVNFTFSYVIA